MFRAGRRRAFSSLAIPNYRRYIAGQVISRVGTWMQRFGQSWLIYEMTKSATLVGVVVALQAVPTLLLGPYGGLVADRFDKRRIMIVLQAMMGVLAFVLGLLTVTHVVRFWEVAMLALLLGVNETFETAARQTFVFEMVGPGELTNALSLNSVTNNVARTVGPALGAGLVATVGLGACFLVNAVSFAAVIAALLMVNPRQLHSPEPTPRARGQLREGIAYVRRSPELVVPLVMMVFIGTLAWEFQTTLPPLASRVFHGGASAYGVMTAVQGIGAITAGLTAASLRRTGRKVLVAAAATFGAGMVAIAVSPNLGWAVAFMFLVGFAASSFSITCNTTLQLEAQPQMRGRVVGLYIVAFQGSTPVGGPIAGFVANVAGPRAAIAMGAASCFAAAGLGAAAGIRRRTRSVLRIEERAVPLPVPVEQDSP